MQKGKMCWVVIFFFYLIFLAVPSVSAQKKISAAQWQADLVYLQKKIHKEYPKLFYKVTAKQFDSAVTVIKKKIPRLRENEIRTEFIRLIAMFKIGHTGVRFKIGDNEEDLRPMFHFYPFTIYHFSDGLFIKSIHAKYKEALGGKLVKIGNSSTADILKNIYPAIPAENDQYFKNNLQYYLRLPELLQALKISESSDAVTLIYSKYGIEKMIKIKAENCPEDFWSDEPYLKEGWVDAYDNFSKPGSVLWMKEPSRIRYFEYLKETKTLYVRHSAVVDDKDETIKDFFEKVFRFADSNEVEKFLLDIRLNPGGNNYHNKPVITGIIQSKKINRYGHLFVITGKATFSAAQNLANELEKYTEAIFVGEPTAENVNFWGDVKTEILPNSKLNIVLSWLWWQNMDPRDKRLWTAPCLAAEMGFDNYQSGYDSALNIILNFKEEKRIDEKLREMVSAGKFEEALSVVKTYMDEPLHRYCRGEQEEKINDIAYSLLMRDKMNEASAFFSLNVQLFPNSANAYDSYAESLWKLGKKEEAINNYKIAISKDPNGPIGVNSKKMLTLIKNTQ